MSYKRKLKSLFVILFFTISVIFIWSILIGFSINSFIIGISNVIIALIIIIALVRDDIKSINEVKQ